MLYLLISKILSRLIFLIRKLYIGKRMLTLWMSVEVNEMYAEFAIRTFKKHHTGYLMFSDIIIGV